MHPPPLRFPPRFTLLKDYLVGRTYLGTELNTGGLPPTELPPHLPPVTHVLQPFEWVSQCAWASCGTFSKCALCIAWPSLASCTARRQLDQQQAITPTSENHSHPHPHSGPR